MKVLLDSNLSTSYLDYEVLDLLSILCLLSIHYQLTKENAIEIS